MENEHPLARFLETNNKGRVGMNLAITIGYF